MQYPDLMVHPRIHAYPDCLQQGKVRKPLRVRPLVSTCELMRWMQTVDVVRFALFNAFTDQNPVAALIRSAGDGVVVGVEKMM